MAHDQLHPSTLARLRLQFDALSLILEGADAAGVAVRPPSGKWSALENLAHLARHHAVFLERLRRMLLEERPQLARYRAEEDPEWPQWSSLPLAEVNERLALLRAAILARIETLTPRQLARTGLHPVLGELSIPLWLEFFLLHEAHHLYVVMGLLKRRPRALP